VEWPTWQQAFVTAAIAVALALVTRPGTGRRRAAARPDEAPGARRWWARVRAALHPAARELAGVAALYGLWRIARELPLTRDEGAIERGRAIWDLQQRLHLPSELALQRVVLDHDALARFMNAYYAIVHVPALLAFLAWLWVRHRDAYPHWRNGLVVTTAGCLVIRYVRVAPPRYLPDLGFVDLATRYGLSVYGPNGTGVSDQMAAMPSIHCGWAAVVGFGIWRLAPRGWRWIGPAHLVLTFVVVAATGNHWWLDGIVAVAILAPTLVVDAHLRRRRAAAVAAEGAGADGAAAGEAGGPGEPAGAGAGRDAGPGPVGARTRVGVGEG